MQAAIPVMKGMTEFFENVGKFTNAHPEGIKLVAEALGGLAVALAGLGTAAIALAVVPLLPGGAVALGIAGIAAAVTAIGAINFNIVAQKLQGLADLFNWFTGPVQGRPAPAGHFIPSTPSAPSSGS
jgi:hypothetical protein